MRRIRSCWSTGRRLAHYNNGSMTRRCEGLADLVPGETLEIHPDDAGRFGIADNMEVAIRSRRGEIRLPARVTERSRPGIIRGAKRNNGGNNFLV
ncbi:MAG: molybdopterin dinucleotide binding domain-containing protein [Thermodesulfobacteriota bacterium]